MHGKREIFLVFVISTLIPFVSYSQKTQDALSSYTEQLQRATDAKYNSTTSLIVVTSSDLFIIQSSTTYYYRDNSYVSFTPSWTFYANALATVQARYDYNYQRVNGEWGRLKNLNLVNATNQSTLSEYKASVDKDMSSGRWDNVDWSRNDDLAERLIAWITEIYSYGTIRSELKLLNSIQAEITRLKYKDPDNFIHSKRYSEVLEAIKELKAPANYNRMDEIAMKYGLF